MLLSAIFALASFLSQKGDVPDKLLVPAPTPDKVVAKVDGVAIKASDVEALLWEWRGQEAIADLISYRMVKNAADRDKVTVPDSEIQTELENQIKGINPALLNGKTPEQYMFEQGFTKSRLWLRIKTELLLNKMSLKEFSANDYVKISTIVVRPTSTSTAAMTAASQKADLFYDMLMKGDAWDKVLNLSTVDEKTIASNGLVGWRKLEAFPFDVQKEFTTLKLGGYTKPKQTANGFQIFRLQMLGKDAKGLDLTDAQTVHIQTAKPDIANKIRSQSKVERILQNPGGQ